LNTHFLYAIGIYNMATCVCDSINIIVIECEIYLYCFFFTQYNSPLHVLAAKCGGTRRDPHGTIASPNYPGSYESNMECEYRIILGVNRRVRLEFETVYLRRRYPSIAMDEPVGRYNDTYDDTLTVYDVDLFNNTSIYTYIYILKYIYKNYSHLIS